jgi:hypothetical protein
MDWGQLSYAALNFVGPLPAIVFAFSNVRMPRAEGDLVKMKVPRVPEAVVRKCMVFFVT